MSSDIYAQLASFGFSDSTISMALKTGNSFEQCLQICLDGGVASGTCVVCTFVNAPGAVTCEMCGIPLSAGVQEVPPPSSSSSAVSRPFILGPEPPKNWVDFNSLKKNHELKRVCVDLYRHILSPSSVDETTVHDIDPSSIKLIPKNQIGTVFRRYVQDFDKIRDRLNTMPALRLIEMTYENGIPQLNEKALIAHSRDCLRYIMATTQDKPTLNWKRHLTRVAEAFHSCQAEQSRVLDSVYGELIGRDKGLVEQIGAIISNKKQILLETICQVQNPHARSASAAPQDQMPHLINTYISYVGEQIGLRGVEAAKKDHCRKQLSNFQVNDIISTFRTQFSIIELSKDIINDVNQQSPNSDRLIDPDVLMRWAGDSETNNGFPSFKIFYDEEAPKGTYGDDPKDNTKPNDENKYRPFLSNEAGLCLLEFLFLKK